MQDVVVAERDLLRSLLQLRRSSDPQGLLVDVLSSLEVASDSDVALVEISLPDADEPPLWIGRQRDTSQPIRATICAAIVDRAVIEQRAIVSASATIDPRLRDLDAVKKNGIDAVACRAIDGPEGRAVVYIQRQRRSGAFGTNAIELVELFAEELAAMASHFARRANAPQPSLHEETRRLRKRLIADALEKRGGNVAQVARDLGVARSFVYSVAREARAVRRTRR